MLQHIVDATYVLIVCVFFVHFALDVDINLDVEVMDIFITVGDSGFVPTDLLNFVVRILVVIDILFT